MVDKANQLVEFGRAASRKHSTHLVARSVEAARPRRVLSSDPSEGVFLSKLIGHAPLPPLSINGAVTSVCVKPTRVVKGLLYLGRLGFHGTRRAPAQRAGLPERAGHWLRRRDAAGVPYRDGDNGTDAIVSLSMLHDDVSGYGVVENANVAIDMIKFE